MLNVNSGCEKVTPSHRIIAEADSFLCAPDKTVTSKEMSFSQTLTKFLSSEDMNKIISCMYKCYVICEASPDMTRNVNS